MIRGLSSEGPVDKKFVFEDCPVGASNLTAWDELAKEHDMKDVVGTLVHSFVHQVRTGLVHSNIHPGNVAMRGDEIYWYDRNLMLELDARDMVFAAGVGALSSEPSSMARAFADYLSGFGQNKGLRDAIEDCCLQAMHEGEGIKALLIVFCY